MNPNVLDTNEELRKIYLVAHEAEFQSDVFYIVTNHVDRVQELLEKAANDLGLTLYTDFVLESMPIKFTPKLINTKNREILWYDHENQYVRSST